MAISDWSLETILVSDWSLRAVGVNLVFTRCGQGCLFPKMASCEYLVFVNNRYPPRLVLWEQQGSAAIGPLETTGIRRDWSLRMGIERLFPKSNGAQYKIFDVIIFSLQKHW